MMIKQVKMKGPSGQTTEVVNTKAAIAAMEAAGWEVIAGSEHEVEAGVPVQQTWRTVIENGADVKQLHQVTTAVAAPAKAPTPAPTPKPVVKVEEKEDLDEKYADMTKDDLKELLDAKKIHYDNRASKAELIEALVKGSK